MHQGHFLPIACRQPEVRIKLVIQLWDIGAIISVSREAVYCLNSC